MDSQYSYNSLSSSSSCESYPFAVYQGEGNRVKPLMRSSYLSSLHSVRRVPRHMTTTKKMPIAPMPPTPAKIYKVLPGHFKEAVQMLTAEPGFRSNSGRLHDAAPPPLEAVPPRTTVLPESACDDKGDDDNNNNVSEWKKFLALSGDAQFSEAAELPSSEAADVFGWFNGPGLGFAPLSPSSLAWWASVLPGAGPPPQLEASAVLL